MYCSIFFVNLATFVVMPGSYDQYCPIARSLDLIGDRWTLLVLRELSLTARRFTDMRYLLPGIPPNVLSQRLKRLGEDGLVTVEVLPPPAARSVYALTERGREVIPVLRSLARFGMPELEPATVEHTLTPLRIVGVIFMPWFDALVSGQLDVDERYDLVIEDETRHLTSRPPGLVWQAEGKPAVTVEGPSWAFVRLRQGASLSDAPLKVEGTKAAIGRFAKLFRLAA
jgi:DNA-binding HxlR family transcriptional regulator